MTASMNLIIFVVVSSVVLTSCEDINLASFNVRIFGQQKVMNQDVVDVLVQRFRDKSETAIEELLRQVNEVNDDAFNHVISDRLGRTSSKEQYSFFYKTSVFTLVDSYIYDDPGDIFEREPFNVRLRVNNWDLVLSAIHTKPDDAVIELSRMVDVYEDLVKRWDLKDVLILGDFNADCSYVRQKEWPEVRLRSDQRFQWYIGDDADTTVLESTDCAYDRFAIAGEDLQKAVSSYKVFDFETEFGISKELAESVSDHYPIEMTLSDEAFNTASEHSTTDGNGRGSGVRCKGLISCNALWISSSSVGLCYSISCGGSEEGGMQFTMFAYLSFDFLCFFGGWGVGHKGENIRKYVHFTE
ncbi:putative deoxyribonuclease-1 [Apostichopus japonicus]|uniref:Putative deoxyribonuclease-1 n=1 Tax=Stichopus japonicus TaxID=307972 RepID=A0A2G8JUX4_STIJA|nr:putative deoxyribonuclease-1 [Apostichopus japonicus]